MVVVKKTLRDFALWTSASGVPHIGRAQSLCMRAFWFIVFIACLVMFGFQMYLLVEGYLRFDVIVNTKLEFRSLVFPAVTICNLNPYKKTSVMNDTLLKTLMDGYESSINRTLYSSDDKWNFTALNDTMAIQARARDHMMYYVAQMPNERKLNLTYNQSEFVMGCSFDSSKVCTNDFTEKIDPTYGRCFTFNDNGTYNSQRAGPRYGLRVLIMTNLVEYLNITESAGVRVTVTGKKEKVYPDAFGYNAAAGFTTSFGLQYVETTRMGPPYGNCTDRSSTEYSVEGCFRECLQQYLIETCGCCDPAFLCKSTEKPCDNSQLYCISMATGTGSKNATINFNAAARCACPELCEEHTYGLTVSTGNWPAAPYLPTFCDAYSGANGNRDYAHEWCSQNTMMVEVFYERMNYQSLTESAAYPMESLISDFGGQIGLWIGVSVITVIEFLLLPILMLIACCCSKIKSKVGVLDEYDEEDNDFDKIFGAGHRALPPDVYDTAPTTPFGYTQESYSVYSGIHHSDAIPPPVMH